MIDFKNIAISICYKGSSFVEKIDQIVEFIVYLSGPNSRLSEIPLLIPLLKVLIPALINFFISSLSAYLYITFLSYKDFDEYVFYTTKLEKKTKKFYRKYVKIYSLSAGFFSAILLHSQFKCVKVLYAAIYGILGPFFLKDKIIRFLSSGPLDRTVKETVSQVDKKCNKMINEKMEKAINDKIIEEQISSKKNYEEGNN